MKIKWIVIKIIFVIKFMWMNENNKYFIYKEDNEGEEK
jgi:hypothetical protein